MINKKLSIIYSSLIPLHLRVIEQSHDKKLSIIYSSGNHDSEDEVHYHYYCKYWMNGFFPSVGSNFVSYIIAERVSSDTSPWAGYDRYHIGDSIVACSKYRSTTVIRALLPYCCEKQLYKIISDILHYKIC